MMRSPITAAFLAISFAFQLLLGASGTSCVDAQHGAMHPAASPDQPSMAGMDMPMAMDMPMDMPTDEGHTPCDQPATSGACQLMGPCSISFIAIPMAELDQRVTDPSRAVGALALSPPSRTRTPELPPPRV